MPARFQTQKFKTERYEGFRIFYWLCEGSFEAWSWYKMDGEHGLEAPFYLKNGV